MNHEASEPRIIQGGMGVAISGWRLASAVARLGQVGVVSGTALAVVLARGLQDGDPGGHLRRGLAAFPDRDVAGRILERYFRPGGRAAGAAYRAVPVPRQRAGRAFLELSVAASFVEVHLAKSGHGGLVGINLLEKLQIPTLPALYGALLAGVDWVLMGAGIPAQIPAALDALARNRPFALPLDVAGALPGERHSVSFDPSTVISHADDRLKRPRFLAIVGSHVLASHLARSDGGRPDGFVVESPVAGGHNAPPRGPRRLNERGEPQYGPRDEVDLGRLRELGIPFWLAGGYGHPRRLERALEQGGCGIQVGTAFALCEESGLDPELKRRALAEAAAGRLRVRTDPVASPTGYPFKVAQLAGTVADHHVLATRQRGCDLSYLTTLYRRPNGTIGYRCPAEPQADYVAKGGQEADTVGRLCLCNGLVAAAGAPQARRHGGVEPALLTLGDDAMAMVAAISPHGEPYGAQQVIEYLLGRGARGGVAAQAPTMR
jgi:NAD(P)H-dependent flavin oxidoreductase YrpB (nitropropane dioxygenase family)